MKVIMEFKSNLLLGITVLALVSCGGNDVEEQQDPFTENRKAVDIVTRTDDSETSSIGLLAGLYMVNYSNEQQVSLLANGNYVNNLQMNYNNGSWQLSSPIYWKDTNINADFYAYSPFTEQVDDARAMAFRVATDQSTQEAFQKSDLLWGTVQNQSPLDGKFSLMLSHCLSRLNVKVEAGVGFSEGELTANDVTVVIGGSKTLGEVDLQTGQVNTKGEVADVKCTNNGDLSFSAILLPQQIPFANLIQIDWKGNKYTLQNSFVLESQRQYTLKIELKKTQSGLVIGIDGWDIINEDFGGVIGGQY